MKDYDITIRINEYGLHLCHAAKVRQNFSTGEFYYNDPFESVPVELSKGEYNMIYLFRSKYPAIKLCTEGQSTWIPCKGSPGR